MRRFEPSRHRSPSLILEEEHWDHLSESRISSLDRAGGVMSLPVAGHLNIEQTLDGQGIRLALHGELDLGSAPWLALTLREAQAGGHKHLLLDLSDLRFMDSAGLALLVRAQRDADSNGQKLSLRGQTPQVNRLLELTGLLDRFTFVA